MPEAKNASFLEHFGDLPDPRVERQKRHKLIDILTITLCAVICGAEGWTDVEDFGKAKHDWLKSFLDLPNGIPSHDTFGRVFSALCPKAFQQAFVNWVEAIRQQFHGEIINVDGKCLRGSHDQALGKNAIQMVSAWSTSNRLVLGQVKTEAKSNEITAIPELLQSLALTGCIVTIDAAGCQKKIAEQIIKQGSDYVLALKGNQGTLHDDVIDYFETAAQDGFKGIDHQYWEQTDKGHGRIEVRRYWVITDLEWLNHKEKWKGLNLIGRVESERHIGDQVSSEKRYYIASMNGEAKPFAEAVRGHWGIENSLHWCLDVSFGEDASRVRKGYASENLAVVRHISLNLIKQEKTSKRGVKARRKLAAWDNAYLQRILGFG